jgi:hypothetical protein
MPHYDTFHAECLKYNGHIFEPPLRQEIRSKEDYCVMWFHFIHTQFCSVKGRVRVEYPFKHLTSRSYFCA